MAIESQSALAKLAADTKTACATSADVIKTAKPGTKIVVTGAKAAVFTHTVYLAAISGVVVGVVAYHFVSKYWFNKGNVAEESASCKAPQENPV